MQQYLNWKTYVVCLALAIVAIALLYFNAISKEMAQEERKKVELLAEGIKAVAAENSNMSSPGITFATLVIESNTSIPLILTDDAENIITAVNFDSTRILRDEKYLQKKIEEFKKLDQVITIYFDANKSTTVYYGNSHLLTNLKYYPILLVALTIVFALIVLIAFLNAQRSIQNQVWVGMSKETAHQLGTPLMSLVGWLEILKDNDANKEAVEEIGKDIERLQLIADRFSKIGSEPQLYEEDVLLRVSNMVSYMQKRAPNNVKIALTNPTNDAEIITLLCGPLFDWVIENLIKNALDAIEGYGKIDVTISNTNRLVTIDISDTGKGIPKNKFKKIFNPGFSTKQRGWGLGLSLAHRIIVQYHFGSLFVKESVVGEGATFRIILRR